MDEFDFDNEDISWNCGICEDPLDRNSYVTMVTTVTGEVIKAEDGRVIDMEPKFLPEVEHLCYNCYTKKYKQPVETLRTCLGTIARTIELIEGGIITGGLGALDKLNELVVYISENLPPRKISLTAIIRKEEDDP